jgi:uncharacterized protein YciI
MQAHSQYWRSRQAQGEVLVFGPVLDPKGAYGMGIIVAPDDAGAQVFPDGDPAIKANIGFTCEINPMRAVTRDNAN